MGDGGIGVDDLNCSPLYPRHPRSPVRVLGWAFHEVPGGLCMRLDLWYRRDVLVAENEDKAEKQTAARPDIASRQK